LTPLGCHGDDYSLAPAGTAATRLDALTLKSHFPKCRSAGPVIAMKTEKGDIQKSENAPFLFVSTVVTKIGFKLTSS
jgi:hypothetical protein